jgi:hypothetical protein
MAEEANRQKDVEIEKVRVMFWELDRRVVAAESDSTRWKGQVEEMTRKLEEMEMEKQLRESIVLDETNILREVIDHISTNASQDYELRLIRSRFLLVLPVTIWLVLKTSGKS